MTHDPRRSQLWWCELPGIDPGPRLCAVNLDSIESVSIRVLVARLGRLSDERIRQIWPALSVAVDCR